MKLFYTPEAVDDLQKIRAFIEEKNPQAASRIGKGLVSRISGLLQLPYAGREVLKAPKPDIVRDLIVGKYVIRYLILEQAIYILRIWHHKENRKDI